jgi:hypothetical protein
MSRENVEIVRAAYDAYNQGGLRGAGVHGYPTGIAARFVPSVVPSVPRRAAGMACLSRF